MPKKQALVLTAAQGHLSIAMAAVETLTKAGWQCNVVKETSRFFSPLWEAYNLIYRYAPHMFKLFFELGQKPLVLESGKIFMLFVNAHKVISELLAGRPDVIISTHFGYNPFLQVVAKTTSIPIINIVSDPRSIHPMIIMPPPGVNLVFDQAALRHIKKLKPESDVEVSGWFVRPKFYQLPSKVAVRKAMRIPNNQFVITIVTGSSGTSSVLPLIKELANQLTDGYIIVVCGSNHRLKKSLEEITMLPSTTLKVIGFTHQVGSLMRAADLVVGKAGPNMLFETMAVGVPFLASTYISGQESGNVEIIKQYQLGLVQTTTHKAVNQILAWQKNPQQLKSFSPHIKKLALHNRQSSQVLLKVVNKLTDGSKRNHGFKLLDSRRLLPRFITANFH